MNRNITHTMRDGFCTECYETAEWLTQTGAMMADADAPAAAPAIWQSEYGTKTHAARDDRRTYCGRPLVYRMPDETAPDCKACARHL